MTRVATSIQSKDDERGVLESWVRKSTAEPRMARLARTVLEAAEGKATKEIAALLDVRGATQ